ncbi:MAG: hypothetical protein ACT4QD_21310 [Acidobacteriota bacterium]
MSASRIRLLIPVLLAASVPACDRATTPAADYQERLTFEGAPPLDLHLRLSSRHAASVTRVASTIGGTLQRLGAWFGPLPFHQLVIADRASNVSESSRADAVVVDLPWRSPLRGGTLEATLVHAMARRFWGVREAAADDAGLREGLALYSAARVLDDQFPNAHAVERQLFGGLVPYVIRSVPVAGAEGQMLRYRVAPDVLRTARALFTLERLLGWGAVQQALSAFAGQRPAEAGEVDRLRVALEAASGRGLAWFFDEAFRSAKVFDYGIDRLDSAPAEGNPEKYHTVVTVRRHGDAVFSGTNRLPSGTFRPSGPLEVLVVFADDHEMRERWDGRAESVEFAYESTAPATDALVDPDGILLLDANRGNNRKTLRPVGRASTTWALRWSAWLQDVLLSYAALF